MLFTLICTIGILIAIGATREHLEKKIEAIRKKLEER